jgi:hypothetical protein
VHIGNKDYPIRVYQGAALATFRLKLIQTDDNKEIESVEVRSQEKHNMAWKIACLGTVRLTNHDEKVPDETEMPPSEDTEQQM